MTITPKQAKWGYTLIGLAFLVFCFYWYYLLEPLQAKLVDAGRKPSLILAILRSAIAGSTFAFLTFVGGTLGGFAWQKFADTVKVRLGDAIESSSFLKWLIGWNAGFLVFTLLWKYGNF